MQEMGKSRAAAFAMGLEDIDESVHVNAFSDALDDAETNDSSHPEGTLSIFLTNRNSHEVKSCFCHKQNYGKLFL